MMLKEEKELREFIGVPDVFCDRISEMTWRRRRDALITALVLAVREDAARIADDAMIYAYSADDEAATIWKEACSRIALAIRATAKGRKK